jgi:hypothetical protein
MGDRVAKIENIIKRWKVLPLLATPYDEFVLNIKNGKP